MMEFITSSFESAAVRRKINYRVELGTGPLYAIIDRGIFEKILFNLLSNAFKFTPEGGEIAVRMMSSDGNLVLSVRDTGIGILSEKIPYIFERFYQADGSSRRAWEGTGIGLSIVREYITFLGGDITVASEVGRGTEFTVTLPLKNVGPRDEFLIEENLASSGAGENASIYMSDIPCLNESETDGDFADDEIISFDKKSILLVEDNEEMRKYIKDILCDYTVRQASNGREGLESALNSPPDIILTDIMMPEMDGNELLRELRKNSRTEGIPVIMLTAKASEDVRLDGLEAGADDYLTKPFNTRELLTRIRNLLKIFDYHRIISERNREIELELDTARQIQSRLLTETEITGGYEHHAIFRPMDKVGGDFYDYAEDEDNISIFIADVSGHGISAAFLALITKVEFNNAKNRFKETDALLRHLHEVFIKYTVHGNFITAFYGIIDKGTKMMRYSSAGHTPPFIYKKAGDTITELVVSGKVIGVFPNLKLKEGWVQLESGDRIIFYTDGITECSDTKKKELFGIDRLIECVREESDRTPDKTAEAIIKILEMHADSTTFEDDVTLLILDIP